MRLYPEAANDPPRAVGQRFDFDPIAFRDPAGAHVGLVHEHDHAAAEHAAIPVVERVDRRIVLIVAAQCREPEHCRVGNRIVF